MTTTTLSSKGQVIIPKEVRDSRAWRAGQKLHVVETPDGILLRPETVFSPKTLDEVAGSLQYLGKAKSLQEMQDAIARRAKKERA